MSSFMCSEKFLEKLSYEMDVAIKTSYPFEKIPLCFVADLDDTYRTFIQIEKIQPPNEKTDQETFVDLIILTPADTTNSKSPHPIAEESNTILLSSNEKEHTAPPTIAEEQLLNSQPPLTIDEEYTQISNIDSQANLQTVTSPTTAAKTPPEISSKRKSQEEMEEGKRKKGVGSVSESTDNDGDDEDEDDGEE